MTHGRIVPLPVSSAAVRWRPKSNRAPASSGAGPATPPGATPHSRSGAPSGGALSVSITRGVTFQSRPSSPRPASSMAWATISRMASNAVPP